MVYSWSNTYKIIFLFCIVLRIAMEVINSWHCELTKKLALELISLANGVIIITPN